MNEPIILDIETYAVTGVADYLNLDEFSAPVHYKDPIKIASYIHEAKQKAVDECALDPHLGRIVAGGWMLVGRDTEPTVFSCRDEHEEKMMLEQLWREVVLPNGAHRRIISFYGLSFDLPYLMIRSLYLGVDAPSLSIDRYRSPHLDLAAKLSFNKTIKAHSLAFFAKRFDLPLDPDPVQGKDIAALVRDGSDVSWRAIQNHCRSDVQLTYLLASRLKYIEYDEDDANEQRKAQDLADCVGF